MRNKFNLDYYIASKKHELEDTNTAMERNKNFIENNETSLSNFIKLLNDEGFIDKHIGAIRQITINSYNNWKERTNLPEPIDIIDKILKHPCYKKAYKEYMQVARLSTVAYTKTISNYIVKYVESLVAFNSNLENIKTTISDVDKHLERNAIDDECVTNLIVFLSRSIREANASLTSANRYRKLIISPPKVKFVYEDAKKSTEEDIKATTERFYGIRRYINDVTGIEIPA